MDKCCYNEELQDWFELVKIGQNKFMCAGCGQVIRE